MIYVGISADSNQCTCKTPETSFIGMEYVTEPLFKLPKSETLVIYCLPQVKTI